MSYLMSSLSSVRHRLCTAAFALCFALSLTAHAENRDIIQFGNDIVVHEGEEAHDVVCFLCSIQIDGTVHGDTVAFLGNLHVRGHAERDAVVFLGNATLSENAGIGRDLVVFAGNLRTGSGATIGNDRVVFPLFFFLLPLLLLVGLVGLIVWAVKSMFFRHRPVYPMPPPRF